MSVLKCENLVLGYDGKAVAPPFSLSIEQGEYLCVVGDNGSGKSTFMKTVIGLADPISGSISFDRDTKKTVGYLPQQTAVQRDFPASALEVVLSGCARDGLFYGKSAREKAVLNMKRTSSDELADSCYRELSGGQQQRILLARALCAADEMLLLDEPVSGLDPQAAADLYGIIDSLNRDGMTVIMISHDIPAVLKYADSVLHIGHETYFASVAEYAIRQGRANNG